MSSEGMTGPREKAQQKGIAALTTGELLQLVIGSGNGQVSVSRIAKKVQRVLMRYGSSVTYDQLERVLGIGPARIGQILAVFELASRYPSPLRQQVIDTHEKAVAACGELRYYARDKLIAITLDGAHRHIATRSFALDDKHPTELLRTLFTDVVRDNAAKLIIAIGSKDRVLDPSLFDLGLLRDVRIIARMFHVTIRTMLLVNNQDIRVMKVDE